MTCTNIKEERGTEKSLELKMEGFKVGVTTLELQNEEYDWARDCSVEA